MNDLCNDIRIMIIKDNGSMDVIFSSNDESNINTCKLNSTDDLKILKQYHNEIKDNVYNKDDNNDKHLFYLKQHIKDNFEKEFKNIGVNPDIINDDLLLYYYMSTMNYVILINSSEHVNIMVIPSSGISNEQLNRINDLKDVFSNNITWCLSNDMHIETFESDGKKYGTLEVGNVIEGKYEDVIDEYENKIKRH